MNDRSEVDYAKNMAYVASPLYYYRRNTSMSVTKPFRKDLWLKWQWWINYMNEFLTLNNKDEKYWQAFYSRTCCSVIPLGGNVFKISDIRKRIAETRSFLTSKELQDSFGHFDYSDMPIYWKLFFFSAKKHKVILFLFLTWCMRKILKLRKS